MDGACCTHTEEKCVRVLVGRLGKPKCTGGITLKWILKKQDARTWTRFMLLSIKEQMAVSCEQTNYVLDSTECAKRFD